MIISITFKASFMLFLCSCVALVDGGAAFTVPSYNWNRRRASTVTTAMTIDRRTVLVGGFMAIALPPAVAQAAYDPVDDASFWGTSTTTKSGINDNVSSASQGGGATQQTAPPAKWPDAPSPLPTAVKSAAELTAPLRDEFRQEIDEGIEALTDLEKALQEKSKKKQVDPRSHG
jgi:hypothetical protein